VATDDTSGTEETATVSCEHHRRHHLLRARGKPDRGFRQLVEW
jgi:hypothetical protein